MNKFFASMALVVALICGSATAAQAHGTVAVRVGNGHNVVAVRNVGFGHNNVVAVRNGVFGNRVVVGNNAVVVRNGLFGNRVVIRR
jgi:hypothetical protein